MPFNPGLIDTDTRKYLKMRGTIVKVGLRVKVPCSKLGADGDCTIYANRPNVCREYLVGGAACRESVVNGRTHDQARKIISILDQE